MAGPLLYNRSNTTITNIERLRASTIIGVFYISTAVAYSCLLHEGLESGWFHCRTRIYSRR
jgi:hypothetical protein